MKNYPNEIDELILEFDAARMFFAEEEEEEASFVVSLKDITERKRAEEAVRESVERYRSLVENIGFGVNMIDKDFRIIMTNAEISRWFNKSAREFEGKNCFKEFEKRQAVCPHCPGIKAMATGHPDQVETEGVREDGTRFPVQVHAFPVFEADGTVYGFIEIVEDITERKKAEEALQESEEYYRMIIENSNDMIWTLDTEGRFLFFNKRSEQITGYRLEDWQGKSFAPLIYKEDIPKVTEVFHKILSGQPQQYEVSVIRKDGSKLILSVNSAPIYSKAKVVGTVSFGRDVTEQKEAEEQIKKSLKEKEILLGEIHHRVKNNMQVISSMLSLQSEYITEEKYRDMFQESQNRILSMSLIHENLYQSRNFAKIDLNEYINDLVNDLFRYYGIDTGNITLNINVENVYLGIDSGIPCGFIINELVTNSLKYAFPDGRKGELKISLRSIGEDMIELLISDNGIGIPKDLDFENTQSLGMYLVKMLAENQLQGEIHLDRSKGTEFKIKFKREK